MHPETRYVKSGDVHIAYQVIGSGPIDLVFVPGFVSHLELLWEDPDQARFYKRLSSFCRLILFDKRGTGMSDRVTAIAGLEQRMDDVRAVIDAVGAERIALMGVSEGGPMSTLFAATYPERTSALITYGTIVKGVWSEDYPWEPTRAQYEAWFKVISDEWPDPGTISSRAPSMVDDEVFKRRLTRYLRMGASPGAVINLFRMNMEIDVRHILPAIHVPTLVLHRAGDRALPIAVSEYLAAQIPAARLVALEGSDHLWWIGDSDAIVDEVQDFLTGERREPESDRVLATVMFTDIVGSTEHAVRIGDARWHDLIEAHDALVKRLIEQFRGRAVRSTGDGYMATFDGPARAVRCARAISRAVPQLGVSIRAGLHTGEIELIGADIGGVAVHTAARVASSAEANEVLVSHTVRDLVSGSGLHFRDRGVHTLKGVPGEWRLYGVAE
jgi:class 3 adenylate cyclase